MFGEGLESAWWMLVLLGAMIIIHELGHYWMARLFDVRIEAFSVGFGWRLFGFKVGETDFKFCAIPFGGYVKMAGEIPGEDSAADARSFLAKPRWQRFLVALAGPLMNVILSVGILTGLFMNHFTRVPARPSPVVGFVDPASPSAKAGLLEGDRVVQVDDVANPTFRDVLMREFEDTNRAMKLVVERAGERKTLEFALPADEKTHVGDAGWLEEREVLLEDFRGDSPAQKAGLRIGDRLVAVDGEPIRTTRHLSRAVTGAAGKPVSISYERAGQAGSISVQPVWTKPDEGPERWVVGIQPAEAHEVVQLSFPDAMRESVRQNLDNAGMVYKFLKGLIERRLSAKSLEGPIGIARLAKSAARQGVWTFLGLMAFVSLQLAVFNLLPIPVLDGGLMLMLLVEMIRRQDLSMRVKEGFLKVGFAFLMMVAVFVLYNDISKTARSGATTGQSPPAPAVVDKK